MTTGARTCGWCRGPIGPAQRRDAVYCTTRCRRTDALSYTSRPRMTDPDRVIGAKPAAFAYWMFRLLGARIGDTLDDLYPGSGGIARAWTHYQQEQPA